MLSGANTSTTGAIGQPRMPMHTTVAAVTASRDAGLAVPGAAQPGVEGEPDRRRRHSVEYRLHQRMLAEPW